MISNFVCSIWSPVVAFILAGIYIVCLIKDFKKGGIVDENMGND